MKSKRITLSIAALCIAILAASCTTPPPSPSDVGAALRRDRDRDLPAPDRQPLASTSYGKWKKSYLLTNATLRVAIVPAVGRITQIGYGAETNLLRNDPALNGKRPRPDTRWMNVGGDWLWPVGQAHWPAITNPGGPGAPRAGSSVAQGPGALWPPPLPMGDAPWDAQAWRNADGSQSCLLIRKYGEPLNLVVTRLITIDAVAPRIRILQRALRVGYSDIPVTLWNVSQCGGAERIFFPCNAGTRNKSFHLNFSKPAKSQIAVHKGVVIFDAAQGGEVKIGSNATNVWIAAQRGNVAILERAETSASGPLPDGCTIELYSNGGLGYSEIETLTPEVLLQPGESLENTLNILCLPLASTLTAAEAATKLRELSGL